MRDFVITRVALAGLMLLMTSCADADEHERPPPLPAPDVLVRVRPDVPVERSHVSGFLHGLSDKEPPNSLVEPLRPTLWRSNLERAPLARVKQLGARYAVALSGLWGYPMEGWRGRGPPWSRPRAWERFVRNLARAMRGEPIVWEVWNEPDVPDFWNGGRDRFLALYALSERILREELGEAVVGGPSISRYSRSWLAGFLRFCRRAGCRPDFLAWHELLPADRPIPSVAAHLRDAHRTFGGSLELHVNEYTGPADQYLPGEAVAYLAALEEGGAEHAARACWPDSGGRSNCDPGRLDGLIGLDGRPRAVWWAYRWYALGADERVEATSSDRRVSVLAGARGRVVLLGRGERRPAPGGVNVDVSVGPLEGERFEVRVERLPNAGEAPLAKPVPVSEEELEAGDGGIRVRVPELGPHEAALVSINPS